MFLLCALGVVRAETVQQLVPTNYVDDFAHVLDAQTQQRLNEMGREIDHRANAQIAVVTVKSLEGTPIEDFASQLFKKWGIGGKKTDRGVLILFAVEDRHYRVEVGYGLEGILNDAKVGTFAREMIPQLRAGDYSGAATALTGRIADVIAEDAKIEPVSGLPAPRAPDTGTRVQTGSSGPSLLTIVVGIVVVLFLLLLPGGRTLLWLLFSMLIGGGGGGGRDDDRGGGFGGFGGGSSGGGGASGEW